ncbi:syntaxin-1A-like [Megalops cyprinoides]|uniref:syntaxin-1A-like n=1 Tax=Megalops cyprinoides TaxID=118141 RepID=UPI001863A6C2|nr:syntaxin-1A-like [Megalops cyprinoides]
MKDRLEELRGHQEDNDELYLDADVYIPGYANPAYSEELPPRLQEFFTDVCRLSAELDKLDQLSEEIHRRQDQVLCSTTKEEVCGEKQVLAQLKGDFSCHARGVREILVRMKEQEAGAGTGAGAGVGPHKDSAEGRIRQCQFNALLRRHTQAVAQHYTWETEYVGRLREQIARQTQLAGLQLGEEEIQGLVEGPHALRLVGTDIPALEEARRQLALAQERHRHLLALEEQVVELHGLFLALAVIATEQQEQLDRVEYNVMRAVDYAAESIQEVKKALQYKRRSRLAALASAALGLCTCCGCLSCMSRGLP